MNISKPNVFISTALIFASLYLFGLGLGVGKEGGNWHPYFLVFIFSLLANLFYYGWYAKYSALGKKFTLMYIPWAFIVGIFLIWIFVSRPWTRYMSLDFGPDPMSYDSDLKNLGFSRHALGLGTMYGATKFKLWEKEFWSENAREEYKLKQIQALQVERRQYLAEHVGDDFKGWSTERIRLAFGEPLKIIQVGEGLEKWIYNISANNLNQQIPIYVQNQTLYKIGD